MLDFLNPQIRDSVQKSKSAAAAYRASGAAYVTA